jgi:8-amino-7-oxononanoate synthase
MESLEQEIIRKLEERSANNSLRALTKTDHSLIDFSSNDYLGLSRNQELQQKIHQQVIDRKLGNGSTGSRLLTGNFSYAEEVEAKLQNIFKAEACLFFNSGYAANLGVLSSLPKKDDTIIYDERSHASIKDGIRLSMATRHPFKHNDLHDLEGKIQRAHGRIFVVVESIYSMDGDECPLPDLIRLKNKYDFEIIVDEAHSTGVVGNHGEGLCVSSQIHDEITIRIYTFGKALGAHGACVATSEAIKQYLINFSRPFIYSTALPPHTIASIDEGFSFIKNHTELAAGLHARSRKYLEQSHQYFRSGSRSAIQTIIIPGNAECKKASVQLRLKGFDVRPILYPTVPRDSERLRICLHSFNSDTEIINLVKEIHNIKSSTR